MSACRRFPMNWRDWTELYLKKKLYFSFDLKPNKVTFYMFFRIIPNINNMIFSQSISI